MKFIKHIKTDWFKYGFESLAVVVGILVAFALDNWNEDRRIREIEDKLLNELVLNLTNDLDILNRNIALHQGGSRACQIILESMSRDQPYSDSLSGYFAMTHNYTVFAPNIGAYESLKSQGIDIIQNDQIRLGLIYLYEQSYTQIIQNIEYFTENIMELKMTFNPLHFEEFHFFDRSKMKPDSYGGSMIPTNFEELKTNQTYLYHLKSLRRGHDFLVLYNEKTINETQNLIELIEKEIQLRFPRDR